MRHSRGSAAVNLLLLLLLAAAGVLVYVIINNANANGVSSNQRALPNLEAESEAEQSTPRLLHAQIVDIEPPDKFAERAIIEGKPFKQLLKRAALKTCAELRAATDDKLLFENLGDEADLHRGEAYTPGRGVVLELTRAWLDPSYGFPEGWTVLPGVFVNTAREVYALRFICPPDSTLYDRLKKGINDDELPVINLSGLFMKNYARNTNDPKEKPWVRPLLICPEPEFPANVEARHAFKELQEAGVAHLLPSKRIEGAPSAEERLVLDVMLSPASMKIKAFSAASDSQTGAAMNEVGAFVIRALATYKQRLPAELPDRSVVILARGGPPTEPRLQQLAALIKGQGVSRVYIKQDFSK